MCTNLSLSGLIVIHLIHNDKNGRVLNHEGLSLSAANLLQPLTQLTEAQDSPTSQAPGGIPAQRPSLQSHLCRMTLILLSASLPAQGFAPVIGHCYAVSALSAMEENRSPGPAL